VLGIVTFNTLLGAVVFVSLQKNVYLQSNVKHNLSFFLRYPYEDIIRYFNLYVFSSEIWFILSTLD